MPSSLQFWQITRSIGWAGLVLAATIGSAHATLERHPLEIQALTEPETVAKAIPEWLDKNSKNPKELARLYLAKANACRVMADWSCQAEAGERAAAAAELAQQALLQVRGLIAQSRGHTAMQDFIRAETALVRADQLLQHQPNAVLQADILLAYSSMSEKLNIASNAARFAERGLAVLGNQEPAIRLRLQRNLARALADLGETEQSKRLLREASSSAMAVNDPKLEAELQLEIARLARTQNDIPTMRASGQLILQRAQQLQNSQLLGLGLEVSAWVAMAEGRTAVAETQFSKAMRAFRERGQFRDERRTLRSLMHLVLARPNNNRETAVLSARLLFLGESLEAEDRRLSAVNFNTQVKFAEQELALQQLKTEAALATEKENAAETRQRAAFITALLSIGLLLSLGVFSVFQRLSKQRLQQLNMQLRDSEKRIRAIADNVPAFIAEIDLQQRYRFVNNYIGKRYKRAPETIVGMSIRELRGNTVADAMQPHIQKVLEGERVRFEASERIDGSVYHYQSSYVPDLDGNGRVQGFYSLSFDISELKRAEAKLAEMARIDSLTGVANRRLFDEELHSALARARRESRPAALLCLDIDHFKAINDQYGHPVGDAVIIAFSKRLLSCVREVDLVARLGGDEFVILIENAQAHSAETIAEKILVAMRQPIAVEALLLPVSTSIGVAYSRAGSCDADFFKLADQALYEAKKAGRNRYHAGPALGRNKSQPYNNDYSE